MLAPYHEHQKLCTFSSQAAQSALVVTSFADILGLGVYDSDEEEAQPESLAPFGSGPAAAQDSRPRADNTITESSAHEGPLGDSDDSPATAPKVAAEAEALEPQQSNTVAPPEVVAAQQTPGQFKCQPGLPADPPPPLTKELEQGHQEEANVLTSAECAMQQAAEHLEVCADRPEGQVSGAAVNSPAAEEATQQGESQLPSKLEPVSESGIISGQAAGNAQQEQAGDSVSGKPQSQQLGERDGQALEDPGQQCRADIAEGSEGAPRRSEPALQQPASCTLDSECPPAASQSGLPQTENEALSPEPAADTSAVAAQQQPTLGRVSSQPAANATPPEPLQSVTAAVDTEAARPAPAPEQQQHLLHSSVPGQQATSPNQLTASPEEAQDPDRRAIDPPGAAAHPLGRPAAEDLVPSPKIPNSLQLDELLGMREELAIGIVAWRHDMRCATCSYSWLSRQGRKSLKFEACPCETSGKALTVAWRQEMRCTTCSTSWLSRQGGKSSKLEACPCKDSGKALTVLDLTSMAS